MKEDLPPQAHPAKQQVLRHILQRLRQLSRKDYINIVWIFALSIILIVVLTLVGVYQFGWQNSWAEAVSRVIPMPVAGSKIGNVSYSDYMLSTRQQSRYFRGQTVPGGPRAVNKLVLAIAEKNLIIENYATAQGVSVTSDQVEERLNAIVATHSDHQAYLKNLAKSQGISLADYRKIIRAELFETGLRRKLSGKSSNQEKFNTWLREQQATTVFHVYIPQAK